MAQGFDIQTGKDMLAERRKNTAARRAIMGQAPLSKAELDAHAANLAGQIMGALPEDVGFVLVLVPIDSDEFGSTASPFDPERTERILKKAERRVRERGRA